MMDDEAVGFFLTSPNTFINQRLTINFTMTNRRLKVDGEGVWRCGREEPRYEGNEYWITPSFPPTFGWSYLGSQCGLHLQNIHRINLHVAREFLLMVEDHVIEDILCELISTPNKI